MLLCGLQPRTAAEAEQNPASDPAVCRPAAPALLAALVQRLLDSRAVAREAAQDALDRLPPSCPTADLVPILAGALQVDSCAAWPLALCLLPSSFSAAAQCVVGSCRRSWLLTSGTAALE